MRLPDDRDSDDSPVDRPTPPNGSPGLQGWATAQTETLVHTDFGLVDFASASTWFWRLVHRQHDPSDVERLWAVLRAVYLQSRDERPDLELDAETGTIVLVQKKKAPGDF